MFRLRNVFTCICMATVLVACGGGKNAQTPAGADHAPVAAAGADTSGTVNQTISLSAAASSDADGDALTYAWSIVSGPAGATLGNATSATATFMATTAGIYVVQVAVTDPSHASSTDSVTLNIAAAASATALTISGVPAHVVLGKPVNVTITLPAPAGSAGVTVNLLSSAPGIEAVPANVQVMAGESSITVPVDTSDVGAVRITASASGLDTATADSTVDPAVLDLVLSTGSAGIMVGGTSQVMVTLRAPAPAGGAQVALALSDSSRAVLAATALTIAAGESTASTTLTGHQAGAVIVTATPASGVSAVSVRVGIVPTMASTTDSSASLIDAALTAGSITSEQALVYKVYAAFGVADLPARFRGNDLGQLDSGIISEAATRIATLSSANQQAIGRYLFPPIYTGSWGEVGTTGASKVSVRKAGNVSGANSAPTVDVSCFENLAGMPRSTELAGWHFIQTADFKIWYPSVIDSRNASYGFYTLDDIAVAVRNVSATIQSDYAKLRAIFGDTVLPDTQVKCNGGDGKIDVYVTRVGLGAKAQVMPHLPGACGVPGWMWIAPDAVLDPEESRNIIAHELVHLFQQPIARANCDDWAYNVLDEATASWAWDHLYPQDNYEWPFASNGVTGYFDGSRGEWLASPILSNSTNSAGRACIGYCDYVFFEWLDRKYGPQAIKNVVEATGSASAMRSYEVGLAGIGGGLATLWPKFALTQWNDYQNHQYDEWNGWEHDPKASIAINYMQKENQAIPVKLNGANKVDLSDKLYDYLNHETNGALDALTTYYVDLKFDDGITRVHFEPRGDVIYAQSSRFKLQALQKIAGEWKPVEDWSTKHAIDYCRDKKAERVDEIVLVYSNSHAGNVPFDKNPPAQLDMVFTNGVADPAKEPKLTASNASCMPWKGTTSVVTTQPGGSTHASATVEWEVYVPPGTTPDPDVTPATQIFVPKTGTAHIDGTSSDASGCVQTISSTDGPIDALGSTLVVNTDSRTVSGGGLTTLQGAVRTLACPGAPAMSVTAPVAAQWLVFPQGGAMLGDDGRTIKGTSTVTEPISGTVQVSTWDFSSAREP